jgi:hypothetical protein
MYKNFIHEETENRLNLKNACYHSSQTLLSSSLPSKNINIKIYKTVILPIVLYGCETWSFALRQEHCLRVVENRLVRTFESKRDNIMGRRRKLHEELHNLHSSPNVIRMIMSRRVRLEGYVTRSCITTAVRISNPNEVTSWS